MTAAPLPRHSLDHRSPLPARAPEIAVPSLTTYWLAGAPNYRSGAAQTAVQVGEELRLNWAAVCAPPQKRADYAVSYAGPPGPRAVLPGRSGEISRSRVEAGRLAPTDGYRRLPGPPGQEEQ